MRLAIFHTELSPYFICCLRQLASEHAVEILMYAWRSDSSAPFDFRSLDALGTVLARGDLAYDDMFSRVRDFRPDAILTCGWVDRAYNAVCRLLRKSGIPVVAGCDTQYTGSWRQHVAALTSPLFVRRTFDVIWAAGDRQSKLARHLGYPVERIWRGYYSCDWERYAAVSRIQRTCPAFIFVGRLAQEKGAAVLAAAYRNYRSQVVRPWPLLIAGKGTFESVLRDAGGTLLGFVQPDNIPELMARGQAFVLPSIFEPWGVVLHEAAAAGLPLLCSDACGAGDHFVRPQQNGLLVAAGSVPALTDAMVTFHNLSPETLKQFGDESHAQSKQFTPQLWAKTLVCGIGRLKGSVESR